MAIAAEIAVKGRRTSTGRLTIAAAVLLAVAVPACGVYALYHHQEALRRDWGGIAGPACPAATQPWDAVAGGREAHDFTYGHTHFRYLFGAADCASVPDGPFITRQAYYVCQFTRPAMLEVAAPGGRTLRFAPRWGQRATVRIRQGQASCVLGGWSDPDLR